MCNKRSTATVKVLVNNAVEKKVRVDACLKTLIENINRMTWYDSVYKHETVACCCGHGRYAPTIIIKGSKEFLYDLVSGKYIPNRRKLYKRDRHGYFYIPEVVGRKAHVNRT